MGHIPDAIFIAIDRQNPDAVIISNKGILKINHVERYCKNIRSIVDIPDDYSIVTALPGSLITNFYWATIYKCFKNFLNPRES